MTWDDLQKLENVVAVACRRDKTAAILGAWRTGLLDYLIIDDRTLSEVEKAEAESEVRSQKSGAGKPRATHGLLESFGEFELGRLSLWATGSCHLIPGS
jgi:Putative sugar-binding domain